MQRITSAQRIALLALPFLLATAIGCKKEFDTPPVRTIPEGSVLTIADLRAMADNLPVQFPESLAQSVYAVVTADEQSGNLYKNVYVQDTVTGDAICLRLKSSGGLYQGDVIRIYLPGTVLGQYQNLLQLDSVDVDNNVVKQSTGVDVTSANSDHITTVQFSQLASGSLQGSLQSTLIRLTNVQFVSGDTSGIYAPQGSSATNRTLENCSGNTTIIRTSSYANFAGHQLPTGKGTITGILSWFGSGPQILIRNESDLQMNGPRCGISSGCDPLTNLSEDFSSVTNNQPVTLDCWTNTFSEGSVAWRGKVSGSDYSAEARLSLGQASTMWLVTPQITFSSSQNLSFSSAQTNWVHDGLTVWVSTDFTGDVSTATWLPVNSATIAGQSDASNTLVASGSVALSGILPSGYTGTFVVAFKYAGDAVNSTTYRVDNIQVN